MVNPLHRLLSRLSSPSFTGKKRRQTPASRRQRPGVEALEVRVVPAITLQNGVVSITGTGDPNTIAINLSDSGAVDVTLDAQSAHFNPGDVNSISVDGGGGSDSLTINDTNTAAGQTYTLTGMTISRSGAAPVSYANVENIV